MSPFDTVHATSYLCSIVTMALSHCNHGPISYHFRDIRRFQSKITKFSSPRLFCFPAEGLPLGIGYQRWGSKTRMMGLRGR